MLSYLGASSDRRKEYNGMSKPDYYGTFDEKHYITQLAIALDGNITYGDCWDEKTENEPAFSEAAEILEEYKYGVLNGLIGSSRSWSRPSPKD